MICVRLLLVFCLFLAPAAQAEDVAATQPVAARAGLVDLTAAQILEDIPDYATILGHQWSEGNDPRAVAAAADWDAYGRLRDTETREALTLSDCIVIALENNTRLKVERLTPVNARAAVAGARAVFDPAAFSEVGKLRDVTAAESQFLASGANAILNQSFDANFGLRKRLLSGGQATIEWTNQRYRTNNVFQGLDPDYVTGLTFSLNQPLLRDFGLRYATILVRTAEVRELQSLRTYEARLAETVKLVEDAYWALVQAIENVQVEEQGIVLAREVERENEDKYRVGTLPETAVLEAKAEVARREATLIRVRNAERIARDNLRALLDIRRPGADDLLSVDPVDRPAVSERQLDLDESLARAQTQRPELLAAQLEIQAQGLSLKAAENQLLPRLDAVGSFGTNGLAGRQVLAPTPAPGDPSFFPTGPNPFAGSYGDALNLLFDGRFYSYTAGVFIEIPLGNAQARSDYASARAQLEQARLEFRRLQQIVTLEVKTAVSNLLSDRESITATRIARELAERNLENQRARYEVGLATTKDLLDFQNQLTLARFQEVDALIRYNTDLAELRRVEGSLLSARNVVIDVLPPDQTPWWARF